MSRFEGGSDAIQYREEEGGDGERGGAALLQKHPPQPNPSVIHGPIKGAKKNVGITGRWVHLNDP